MRPGDRAAATLSLQKVAASDLEGPGNSRVLVQEALLNGMAQRTKGVTAFPTVCSNTPCSGGFAAYVHVEGRPRWGPVRQSVKEAKQDRKSLLDGKRAKQLDEVLSAMHAAALALIPV